MPAAPTPTRSMHAAGLLRPFERDGNRRGTGFEPAKIMQASTAMAWLCGCKHSARAPLCGGTHNRL
jgi:hypothetical protein